jgi:hypothetical protein
MKCESERDGRPPKAICRNLILMGKNASEAHKTQRRIVGSDCIENVLL